MAIKLRGGVWWIDFIAPDGTRVRKSARTSNSRAAQELHDQVKAESWRVQHLGDKPVRKWDDAVVQWLKEKGHKASLEKDKEIFRWVDAHLRGKALASIDRPLLHQILEAKACEAGQATANRYMALIRAVLRRACEVWEWTERVPRAPMFRAQSRRVRWITVEESERLLSKLPEHQAEMARFALATGLRQQNVCRLQWKDVDLVRRCAWVHPDQSKTRKAIAVPLNADAVAVLERLKGRHAEFVFTYNDHAVWQVNTKSWRKAVAEAGLVDFRWHDLRHTWASRHAQAGTPLNVVQEMGGWRSYDMVLRYSHLSAEHLLNHAERIATAGSSPRGAVPQSCHN
ncbi:MAG: site-specific integrase [Xanthomonadaceae bacterium]|nr:site-specific integrase [Xanthomonadaceae bacterium]